MDRYDAERYQEFIELCEESISLGDTAVLSHTAHEPALRTAAGLNLIDQWHILRESRNSAALDIATACSLAAEYFMSRLNIRKDSLPLRIGTAYSKAMWYEAEPDTGTGEIVRIVKTSLIGAKLYESATVYDATRHVETPEEQALRVLRIGRAVVWAEYQAPAPPDEAPPAEPPDSQRLDSYIDFLRSLRAN